MSGIETLRVEIRFYGLVRDIAGESHLEIRVAPDSTVADLLDSLADRYGERFWQRVMDSSGKLSRFVELIVNGRQVDRNALDTPLAGDDPRQPAVVNVLVLPPSAGG
ncbi:MAG: MoaD/ThiS family protein [Dehalococcoidia bacterium]|nr:MoaD/ThiS family protein [Dehalococcoidia bacterium]